MGPACACMPFFGPPYRSSPAFPLLGPDPHKLFSLRTSQLKIKPFWSHPTCLAATAPRLPVQAPCAPPLCPLPQCVWSTRGGSWVATGLSGRTHRQVLLMQSCYVSPPKLSGLNKQIGSTTTGGGWAQVRGKPRLPHDMAAQACSTPGTTTQRATLPEARLPITRSPDCSHFHFSVIKVGQT